MAFRTIVKDWDKSKLEEKVKRMIKEGWTQKSEIKLQDKGLHHGTYTYACLMEMVDKKKTD